MPTANPVAFLKSVKGELNRVTWPTKDHVIKLTGVVIGISLLVGVFIGLLDFIFTKLIEIIVK